MGKVVILGVFVADVAFRADRMPRMGETILGKSFALGPGGKGSNQAVACARIGAETHFLTRLGTDDFAVLATSTWNEARVVSHAITTPDSHTGSAFIFLDDATGDNAIIIAPGAAAMISPDDVVSNRSMISDADVFVTQLEQPLEAAITGLRIARESGASTILNPAPAAELPDGMLSLCDYVTPNETECEELTGVAVDNVEAAAKACEELVQLGVRRPIITMGERGAYLHDHGLVPAVNAGAVVETTGAGDAFNGAFAAAIAEGLDDVQAVQIGCATAGLSVTRAGTAPSMPMRSEVDALIQEL